MKWYELTPEQWQLFLVYAWLIPGFIASLIAVAVAIFQNDPKNDDFLDAGLVLFALGLGTFFGWVSIGFIYTELKHYKVFQRTVLHPKFLRILLYSSPILSLGLLWMM